VKARQVIRDVGERCETAVMNGRLARQRCRFSVARETDGQGVRRSADGEPPTEASGLDDGVGEAMQALGGRHENRARLRCIQMRTRRIVESEDLGTSSKRGDVWALVGDIEGPGGRSTPVGWSGQGAGLDRLRDPALNARLDWLVAANDGASPGEAGAGPVLLSAQAAAVLTHEAIGHFVEGSLDDRIDLSHRLGRRIATAALRLIDDPGAAGGAAAYDSDDEAMEVLGATEVVRDGVIVGQLHSCRSAARAGVLSTGNGRAGVWAPPLPRMSNLVCAPGDHSEDALIERLWRGLMIHHLAHGYGQGTTVEARVALAEEVERGRRTGRYIAGLRVADTVGLFLRTVAVGDVCEANPNGLCGKAGQVLFDVGTIAPPILLDRLELRR
jgi:predicted Zn-dependent protease